MANLESEITGVVKGDDYDIVRTITLLPDGEVMTEAWFTIKLYHWSASHIIQKNITSTYNTTSGGILDTGVGDEVGKVIFHLNSADTTLLEEYHKYSFDIRVKTNNNQFYTPEYGYLIVSPSVAVV